MSEQASEQRAVCQICGVSEDAPDNTLSRASVTASRALPRLAEPGLAWLRKTYGLVPGLTCASCFGPAYEGANQTIWMAAQVQT